MLVDHVSSLKYLFRIGQNTSIEFSYELLVCRVHVDHVINSRFFLVIEQNISVELF